MKMHKLLISVAGLFTAQAQITNLSNQCDYNGYVTTSFTYTAKPNEILTNIEPGRCKENDANYNDFEVTIDHGNGAVNSDGEEEKYITIRYNANQCAYPEDHHANPGSLPANSTVNIAAEDRIDSTSSNLSLLLRTHTIVSRCEYGTNYKASFQFGQINLSEEDNGELVDTGILSFGMRVFKDADHLDEYGAEETFYSGEMAYVTVFINAGSLPVINGQTGVWAPVGCTFSHMGGSGDSYSLYPYTSSCAGDFADNLNFAISRETSTGNWAFQYKLFLFEAAQNAQYRLECDIELCTTDDVGGACHQFGDKCHNPFSNLFV